MRWISAFIITLTLLLAHPSILYGQYMTKETKLIHRGQTVEIAIGGLPEEKVVVHVVFHTHPVNACLVKTSGNVGYTYVSNLQRISKKNGFGQVRLRDDVLLIFTCRLSYLFITVLTAEEKSEVEVPI